MRLEVPATLFAWYAGSSTFSDYRVKFARCVKLKPWQSNAKSGLAFAVF
jgi:hypothetical protein